MQMSPTQNANFLLLILGSIPVLFIAGLIIYFSFTSPETPAEVQGDVVSPTQTATTTAN